MLKDQLGVGAAERDKLLPSLGRIRDGAGDTSGPSIFLSPGSKNERCCIHLANQPGQGQ